MKIEALLLLELKILAKENNKRTVSKIVVSVLRLFKRKRRYYLVLRIV